eukprot:124408-Rhodomonas_salina.1
MGSGESGRRGECGEKPAREKEEASLVGGERHFSSALSRWGMGRGGKGWRLGGEGLSGEWG